MDLSSLVGVFVGAHCIVAQRYEVPELMMEMSEGQALADATQNVLRHYSIETTQKAVDWASLCGMACMLYGSRFGAYVLRKHAERQPAPINVPMREAPEPTAKPNVSGHAPAQSAPAQSFAGDAIILNADDPEDNFG